MANTYSADPTADTVLADHTMPVAWASSSLGDPSAEIENESDHSAFADPVGPAADRNSLRKGAALAALLAGAIGGGVALGLVLYDPLGPAQTRTAVIDHGARVDPAATHAPGNLDPANPAPGPTQTSSAPDNGPSPVVSSSENRPSPQAVISSSATAAGPAGPVSGSTTAPVDNSGVGYPPATAPGGPVVIVNVPLPPPPHWTPPHEPCKEKCPHPPGGQDGGQTGGQNGGQQGPGLPCGKFCKPGDGPHD
jgi:hypothetical protein